MITNVRKLTLAAALGLIAGFTGPATAGWDGQLNFGGYAPGCGYYGCPAPPPPPSNPTNTGYHAGDVFGPQTGSGHAGGNTGWNNCTGCLRLPQAPLHPPVIRTVAVPHR
jgi:hypothetical protein